MDPLEVDLAYVEKSYWVGPGSKNVRGYELLRTVLDDAKKVALAKVKIRTRTRLALLRPRGRLFSLDMMRFAEELVPGDEIAPAEGKESSDREKQLALHLVDELTGPFDPARHPDEYRSAVLAAVDEKVEAGAVARDTTAGEAPAEAARHGRRRRAGHRSRRAPVAIDQGRREARPRQDEGRRREQGRSEARQGQERRRRRSARRAERESEHRGATVNVVPAHAVGAKTRPAAG